MVAASVCSTAVLLAGSTVVMAQPDDRPEVSTRRQGNIVVIESSSQTDYAATPPDEGAFAPMVAVQRPGPGWNVEWSLALSSTIDNKKVNHYFARTRRLSGSGNYRAHAHAALVRDSYQGEQVFSGYTHSCATKTVTNATAQTCMSPWFSTSTGKKWVAVSGHWYDHGNTGSADATCPGCIDFVWTTP